MPHKIVESLEREHLVARKLAIIIGHHVLDPLSHRHLDLSLIIQVFNHTRKQPEEGNGKYFDVSVVLTDSLLSNSGPHHVKFRGKSTVLAAAWIVSAM